MKMDGTENDISKFSTSSEHRLPTISATEALQNAAKRSRGIPTGLPSLDDGLQSLNPVHRAGGIQRGQLTEIYGPPGVGKTSFALQLAVNTIQSYDEQSHVVWIDTGSQFVPRRFRAMMAAYRFPEGHEPPSSPPGPRSRKQTLEKISYFSAQSLPKLLTLFLHPTALFPPPQTALTIVDDLSNLIQSSFPRSSKLKQSATLQNGLAEKLARKAANRKWTIVADLASAMSKMAALKGIAIMVLNQTATTMKGGRKAALKSALSAQGWDAAVRTRILLYRDFPSTESAASLSSKEARNLRFAQVTKIDGSEVTTSESVLFVIERGGLRQITHAATETDQGDQFDSPPALAEPSSGQRRPPKRKVEEIADSEDEDDDIDSGEKPGVPAEGDPAEEPPDPESEEEDGDEGRELPFHNSVDSGRPSDMETEEMQV